MSLGIFGTLINWIFTALFIKIGGTLIGCHLTMLDILVLV